jgi:hypothetical protein
MRKYLCLLLLVICPFAMHVHAQRVSTAHRPELYDWSQKKYTFTIQPLQFYNASLKMDFEMRLGDGPGWLQFSPAVYYSNRDMDDNGYYENGTFYYHGNFDFFKEPYTKLRGGGLDVNYKRFLNPRRTFYTAAGLTYTHLNIKYWGWEWNDYIEDGLEYHSYVCDFQTQRINRVGINCYFGHQIPTRRAFVYDMFWGWSYRHSFSDKNKSVKFNNHMFSHGYTGFVFIAGVRIGFGLK